MKTTSCRNLGKSNFSQLLKSCMDREILVIVWVQAGQEKGKRIDCCLVKLWTAACVWVAPAKKGNQRVLVLPKAVNSLQHQMGLNSVHGVVEKNPTLFFAGKMKPFQLVSHSLWARMILFSLLLCCEWAEFSSTKSLAFFTWHTLKPSWPMHKTPGSSLGQLQTQWWYEECCSSSVVRSWHFISRTPICAWSQAVFP